MQVQQPALVIRATTNSDYFAWRDVIRRAWEQAYTHTYTRQEIMDYFTGRVEGWAGWREQRASLLGHIVAELDQQVVGTASLARLTDGDAELVSLYVDPPYQQRGIGHRLWQVCLALLRKQGIPALKTWVLATASAVHFYERRGCRLVGTDYFYIGSHAESVLCYRLELPPPAADTGQPASQIPTSGQTQPPRVLSAEPPKPES